jgi:hypothetical protein
MIKELYDTRPEEIRRAHEHMKSKSYYLEKSLGPRHDETRKFKYYEQQLGEMVSQLDRNKK